MHITRHKVVVNSSVKRNTSNLFNSKQFVSNNLLVLGAPTLYAHVQAETSQTKLHSMTSLLSKRQKETGVSISSFPSFGDTGDQNYSNTRIPHKIYIVYRNFLGVDFLYRGHGMKKVYVTFFTCRNSYLHTPNQNIPYPICT